MAATEEFLVGCSGRDPERQLRQCERSSGGRYAGRCLSCHTDVWVNVSAHELFRSWDHDPRVVCRQCFDRYGDDVL